MKLVPFVGQTVVIAKDQPEYLPMPAHRHNDEFGTVTCCWKLNRKERIKLLFSGKVWHNISTFWQPLQPQLLSVNKPEMK